MKTKVLYLPGNGGRLVIQLLMPVCDSCMLTGWMHNRVRMIVASLLVKHLLHSWHAGAEWFWDTRGC